jgi:hypothetical protein
MKAALRKMQEEGSHTEASGEGTCYSCLLLLLAWRTSEKRWRFPVWQFGSDGRPLEGLSECIAATELDNEWNPGEAWPEHEFRTHRVRLVNGEEVSLQLAERGVRLSNDLWVREVRQRSESGAQSSILSTDYRSDLSQVAVAMFAKWCQENFLHYMRQHYNLDRLAEYGVEPVPDTTRVINPAWRQLDSQIRRQNGLLSRQLVEFAEIQLPQDLEPEQVQAYELSKGQLQQAIENRRQEIEQLKAQRKAVAKHILLKDLPEQDRFQQLRAEKKHFLDTIKLIAYRGEAVCVQRRSGTFSMASYSAC